MVPKMNLTWKIVRIKDFLGSPFFPLFFMKTDLLVWNVQGAASRNFSRVMKEYLCDYKPDMVVLVETRVSGVIANRVIFTLGMSKSHRVEERVFEWHLDFMERRCGGSGVG